MQTHGILTKEKIERWITTLVWSFTVRIPSFSNLKIRSELLLLSEYPVWSDSPMSESCGWSGIPCNHEKTLAIEEVQLAKTPITKNYIKLLLFSICLGRKQHLLGEQGVRCKQGLFGEKKSSANRVFWEKSLLGEQGYYYMKNIIYSKTTLSLAVS